MAVGLGVAEAIAELDALAEAEALAPEPEGPGLAGVTAVVIGALMRSPLSIQ